MDDKNRNLIKKTGFAGQVLSMGLTGGICLAISLYLGYQFDLYFSSNPIGIVLGISIGIASAGIQTWKQLQESLDEFERNKHKRKD